MKRIGFTILLLVVFALFLALFVLLSNGVLFALAWILGSRRAVMGFMAMIVAVLVIYAAWQDVGPEEDEPEDKSE